MVEANEGLTMQRILDSAERLFAEHGYAGTSLRAITSDAGVNLAAVNYHFGSKEELVKRVFERKMVPANRARIENLEKVLGEARSSGHRPAVKDLFRAFVDPAFELALGNAGGRSFVRLIWRSMADTEGFLNRNFIESARPALTALHEAICQALPTRDPQDVLFSLIISMSTMGSMLIRLSADKEFLSFALKEEGDFRELQQKKDKLIDFITAGMEAG